MAKKVQWRYHGGFDNNTQARASSSGRIRSARMENTVQNLSLLVVLAALVAMLARRFNFPYTIGLVAAGMGLAAMPWGLEVEMTRELIFSALLPPLIFEAALFLPWKELKKELAPVLAMATAGFLLAAGATALGMAYFASWPWIAAAVFGVLIAATDPVSVIATFKEAGVKGRLRILVEGESLSNDGMAAVCFALLMGVFQGLSPAAGGVAGAVAQTVLTTVGGGIAIGGAIAALSLFLAGKTDDHLVELTFTSAAAYGSFLLAEHWHCSGVLATLTAGLVIGSQGHHGALTQKGAEAIESFWEFAAFVANSLIFMLIGVQEMRQDFNAAIGVSLIAIVVVTLGRALTVYPVLALFSRSKGAVPARHQHILFWGGLRGAMALALAMGLPADMPLRETIVTVTFAVVAFSLVVQGLSMKWLLRKMGVIA